MLLTEEGQERALDEAGINGDPFLRQRQREYEASAGEAWCIPAIFKRQESWHEETWEAGFSFPWFRQGHRIRLLGEVRKRDVVKIFSPFDIFKCPMDSLETRWRKFFDCLREASGEFSAGAGIYGSAALTILSGLPYLHRDSDIDLIVEAIPVQKMAGFYRCVQKISEEYGIRMDMEIRVDGEGDVKAQELFCSQNTIVVRGKDGVWIRNRKKMEDKINVLTDGR